MSFQFRAPGHHDAPVTVLIVDDQASVRMGLEQLITSSPMPLRGVHAVATGVEALEHAARLHPELVLLDVDLAGEDGLALLPDLARDACVVVLTSHGDAATRARASRLGAMALFEKHEPAHRLIGALCALTAPQVKGELAPTAGGVESGPAMGPDSAALGPAAA